MRDCEPIFDGALFERERDSNAFLPPLLCGCAALTFTAGFAAWVLSTPPVSTPQIVVVRSAADSPPARRVANPYGGLVAFAAAPSPPPRREANPYGALVDLQPEVPTPSPAPRPRRRTSAAAAPVSLRPTSPCRPSATSRARRRRAAAAGAAARIRRSRHARARRAAAARARRAPPRRRPTTATRFRSCSASAGPARRRFVARLRLAGDRGRPRTIRSRRRFGFGLFDLLSRSSPPAGYDRATAVYDISARTVYLPDGTRLEAHSGLGDYLDDPRHVDVRMRGATPPHVYELQPREELFHGVAALRLVPVGGDGSVYGRAGLLAHTYMLGPNGDSNGCVSFKDYDAFLKAFQDGKITRLAVVAKL